MSALTIGLVLFPDCEELDWVGPYEVFTMAGMEGDLNVVTIAQQAGPLTCAKGLRVLPDHTFDDAPPLDVVLVPGGQGTRVEMNNPAMLEWLAKAAEPCRFVTSVCTGSVVLCKAGLVPDGAEVTTHWGFIEALREHAPQVEVREQVRYVQSGRVVTSAGVSAGIDMSLWLVGELFDVEHAKKTRRFMEYDPAPPY